MRYYLAKYYLRDKDEPTRLAPVVIVDRGGKRSVVVSLRLACHQDEVHAGLVVGEYCRRGGEIAVSFYNYAVLEHIYELFGN